MNGPKYGRAFPPSEREPYDVPSDWRIIWLQTVIGVMRLNTDEETFEVAVHQADKVIERLRERPELLRELNLPRERRSRAG